MIRVIVVDDHPVVRLGIKGLLESVSDIQVVGEAGTGEAVIRLVREVQSDVILMDLSMPGSGGLVATHRLLRVNPQLKIIIITFCEDDPFPERLVRAGASGYITKKSSQEELVKAIRRVMAGQLYITPDISQRMALQQLSDAKKSPFSQLSLRELQVMVMITEGQEVDAIAKMLCLSPKTVNTYRYRLFDKLGVRNNVELTHYAIRCGLLKKSEKLLEESKTEMTEEL